MNCSGFAGRRKKNKAPKRFLVIAFLLSSQLHAHSQDARTIKINDLYSCLKEYDIECPKTVLAIAIYETGWMECQHCTYQFNNLFGFRANHDYLRFKDIYECLAYLRVWQSTYYDPWKKKHPAGTYYDYLAHVKYAHANISHYLLIIKSIERLIAKDVKKMDDAPLTYPSIELEGR
jgi:hypothetical protein